MLCVLINYNLLLLNLYSYATTTETECLLMTTGSYVLSVHCFSSSNFFQLVPKELVLTEQWILIKQGAVYDHKKIQVCIGVL